MRFDDSLLRTYPQPIALAAKDFNDATERTQEYMCLANLFEVTLKYLVSIALAHYLRDEYWDDSLQKNLKLLSRPSLGVWGNLLRSAMKFSESAAFFALPEFRQRYFTRLSDEMPGAADVRSWCAFAGRWLRKEQGDAAGRDASTLQGLVDLMVEYRNRTWGHGLQRVVKPEIYEEHREPFFSGMQGLLAWMDFLRAYPLRYVKEVYKRKGRDEHLMFDFMGTEYRRGDVYVGDYAQEHRLYLCEPSGGPILTVHPLFVVYHSQLYVLDYHDVEHRVRYINCVSGVPHDPTRYSSLIITRIGRDAPVKLKETELPLLPEEDGLDARITPSNASLSCLLDALDERAKQALELGLGESLRIGRFWLGLEFLLMGLSRIDGSELQLLLRDIGLEPDSFRGTLRGMAGVATQNAWRGLDIDALGRAALPRMQAHAPPPSASEAIRTLATPRLLALLREAYRIAGTDTVSEAHLTVAALGQRNSLAIQVLLQKIVEAKKDPAKVLASMMARLPVPVAASAADDKHTSGSQAFVSQRRETIPGPAPHLYECARDLTAAARAHEIMPPVGVDGHVRQLRQLLLQERGPVPLLVGELGVGKTAIAHGLACDLARGDTEDRLLDVSFELLLSQSIERAQLDVRLGELRQSVHAHTKDIILFDELQDILGGRSVGAQVVRDWIKSLLMSGEVRCLAIATVAEPSVLGMESALKRRFEIIPIGEPDVTVCMSILASHAPRIARGYGVVIDPAVFDLVIQRGHSARCMEKLPGAAILLLHEACEMAREARSTRVDERLMLRLLAAREARS